MAEPTHIGTVFVFGADGTVAWTGTAAATVLTSENEPQEVTATDDITRHVSKSKQGETIGIQLYDPNPKVRVVCMPCAAATGSGAIAAAKANVFLPKKGTAVTLAGFAAGPGSGEDYFNSSAWLYLGGGEIALNNEREAVVTMTLERFNTALATNNS